MIPCEKICIIELEGHTEPWRSLKRENIEKIMIGRVLMGLVKACGSCFGSSRLIKKKKQLIKTYIGVGIFLPVDLMTRKVKREGGPERKKEDTLKMLKSVHVDTYINVQRKKWRGVKKENSWSWI